MASLCKAGDEDQTMANCTRRSQQWLVQQSCPTHTAQLHKAIPGHSAGMALSSINTSPAIFTTANIKNAKEQATMVFDTRLDLKLFLSMVTRYGVARSASCYLQLQRAACIFIVISTVNPAITPSLVLTCLNLKNSADDKPVKSRFQMIFNG